VEAIRYLDCSRRPISAALSVGARSIPDDDLHTGVLPQPVGQRIRRPIAEKIDGGMGFHIHQNRSVAVSPTEREIVDSKHSRC
jgi:hypothetical protein